MFLALLTTASLADRAAVGRRTPRRHDEVDDERLIPLVDDADLVRTGDELEWVVVALEVVDAALQHTINVDSRTPRCDIELHAARRSIIGQRNQRHSGADIEHRHAPPPEHGP